MKLMFDASRPPAHAPAGYGAVAGYLASTHTPHVWTAAEWHRFKGLRKLPIYVASIAVHSATAHPVTEAFGVLRQLHWLNVPHGNAVALDLETAVNASFVRQFGDVLTWAGYHTWVYGSASTVFRNPPLDGYWVADYRGIGPFMHGHANVRATQYADGASFDSSTVRWWSFGHRLIWK